jgi:hypothetical protein
MRSTNVLALLIMVSLLAIPALAELDDYQKGVEDGLTAGLRIGKLLGAAPFDPYQAQTYNAEVDPFNQGLSVVFGNNQTALNLFWMKPYGSAAAATAAISRKPVHSIDGSWNNTTRVVGDQDVGKRIYDMPASSYYTWVGNAPDLPYTGSSDSLGGV